ncbi:Hypothetical protein CM240_1490 [Clostridium bornimense]|uniref:Uncharacterized protein n=1 Tax=Clostridium bornimense TaxID=1216932 RepID=W6RYE6_9CLOT|nr:cation-transporting P-type ATPase [Clostridium bornimense]CDM68649.1 Hypothetical protein CM240_1490 [Clostridium bornimense]
MHSLRWDEVLRNLDTTISTGLSSDEIDARRSKYGDNVIKEYRNKIFNNLKNFIMSKFFLIATVYSVFTWFYSQYKIVCYISLLFVLLIAFIIIRKVNNPISFDRVNNKEVRVKRDGLIKYIKSAELVVGDIVFIEEDDISPADIRIIQGNNITVKEIFINGEDVPVNKFSLEIDESSDFKERSNILYKGSKIVSGHGIGVVIAVGYNTKLGEKLLDHVIENNRLKLLKYIDNMISPIYVLSMIISIFELILMKNSYSKSLAITLPLIPVYILLFIKCIKNEFRKDEIEVSGILDLEKLNNTDYIVIEDKDSFYDDDIDIIEIIIDEKRYSTLSLAPDEYMITRAFEILHICSLDVPEGFDNKISKKIIDFLDDMKFNYNESKSKIKSIFTLPYNIENDVVTKVIAVENGYRAYSLGNINTIINSSTFRISNELEVKLEEDYIEKIKELDIEMSKKGFKTVAFSYRAFNYKPSEYENIESNMVFVGVLVYKSRVNCNYETNIQLIRDMNIKVLTYTNDNKLVAFNKGKLLGNIYKESDIISGVELKNIDKDEMNRNIEGYKVLSKVTKDQIEDIVKELRIKKYNILYSGDSIGDLGILKESSVSIYKGNNNNSLCKEVCDFTIKNNHLTKILKGMELSKQIIKRFNYIQGFFISFFGTVLLSNIIIMKLCERSLYNYIELFILNVVCISIYIGYLMLNLESEKVTYYKKYKFNNSLACIKLNIKDIVISTLIILIPFIIPFLQFSVKKYLSLIIFILIYTIKALLNGYRESKVQDIILILPSIIILLYIFLM